MASTTTDRTGYVSLHKPDPPPFPEVSVWRSDDYKIGWASYWLGFPRGDKYYFSFWKGWKDAQLEDEWRQSNGE